MAYSALLDLAGNRRVDMVRADDGSFVLTGKVAHDGEVVDVEVTGDAKPTEAYRAWLEAGGKLGDPVPPPRAAYGDDLITALSDAELAAMSGGTLRDQRMLSAQRAPFSPTDDIIVRLAAAMKVDPKAWFARLPG